MNRVKCFFETMARQLKNPRPQFTEPQGLEVMLTNTPDNFCASASLSALALIPSGFEN